MKDVIAPYLPGTISSLFRSLEEWLHPEYSVPQITGESVFQISLAFCVSCEGRVLFEECEISVKFKFKSLARTTSFRNASSKLLNFNNCLKMMWLKTEKLLDIFLQLIWSITHLSTVLIYLFGCISLSTFDKKKHDTFFCDFELIEF